MAAARGRAGRRALGAVALAAYAFLYAPLVVLVALSFNRGRLSSRWEGFTLAWYARALTDPRVLESLWNSLVVALAVTGAATVAATLAALGFRRMRGRVSPAWDGVLVLPLVVPEIVLGASLVLLFAALSLTLSLATVVLAHLSFCVSYAVLVVRARLAALPPELEEGALDLGATPWQTFRRVTLPLLAPGIAAAALLVFALSIDDYVVASFVAGVGATTLPVHVYSMVKSGLSPAINAVSTLLVAATGLLLFAAWRLEQGAPARRAALPALLGLLVLGAPFALTPAAPPVDRELNVYIWSNYLPEATIRRFEARHRVKVNVDLYDSNEALVAKLETGAVGYDVVCPSNYAVEVLIQKGLLRPLDRGALPHLANVDPAFLDRPHDRGNRYTIPYFWGTTGIGYRRSRVGDVASWDVLWDPRYAGRILMLDDAREAFGAALKVLGHSLNTRETEPLVRARDLLLRQKSLVRAYNSSNFEDALLSGEAWVAQAWNGQLAKAMDQDPDIGYVVPREGSSLFLDSLVIPKSSPHPELAHAFLDYVMEAEVAAEICAEMRYSTPNRAAVPLLPESVRANPAVFPPPDVLARAELLEDVGPAAVVYDRLWTEVKSR
jgi:spermidine/putrescine transport system permease protein